MSSTLAYAAVAIIWAALALICWSVVTPAEKSTRCSAARAFLVAPIWPLAIVWLAVRPFTSIISDARRGHDQER